MKCHECKVSEFTYWNGTVEMYCRDCPLNPNKKEEQVEKNALAAARAAGLRNGWTRAQALAAGIVRPFSAAASGLTAERFPVTAPREAIR